MNDLADRFGFRRIAEEDIEPLRRAGPREVLARLNVPAWKLPMIVRHTRRLKSAHLDDIPLFPGTGAMLRALKEGGLSLALVSSDTLENATRQLGAANAALFSHFACGASLFGKAAKFRRVLRRARADARCAIAIGDEVRDVEAARAAGIACAVVTWGYAAAETLRALQPDLVFEQMEDNAARGASRCGPPGTRLRFSSFLRQGALDRRSGGCRQGRNPHPGETRVAGRPR